MIPLRRAFYELLVLFLFQYTIYNQTCPSNKPYYESNSLECYSQCPWFGDTKYYKYNIGTPKTCVDKCPGSYYGFDGDKTCTTTCPNNPIQTYYDSVNKRCVEKCPANYFGYLGSDSTKNQKCLANCPTGTFANFKNGLCVQTCPSDAYYMDGAKPICTEICPANYYGSPIDRYCKLPANCPDTPIQYFADDTTNLCVQQCPSGYYADSHTSRCSIFCSLGYFADQSTGVGICVQNCPEQNYRDNITRSCLRQCPKGYYINQISGNCTDQCPTDTFGDNSTGKCSEQCLAPTYGDSINHVCVLVCPIGTYADNFTRHCVDPIQCYGNTVGDPTTRLCVTIQNCPSSPYYYGDLVSKICRLKCPATLWGDKSTKRCLSQCPWNPGTYVTWKNIHTQQCVTKCPEHPISYASNHTQQCVTNCPQPPLVPQHTFADQISQQCVETCPNGFFSETQDYICRSSCDSNPQVLYYYAENASCIDSCPQDFFADISKQMCVQVCPQVPSYYGYQVDNVCLQQCPQGYFADNLTRMCLQACPAATQQYGDISTNTCVDKCPMIPDLYGQDLNDGNKTCVATCQDGFFADPISRTCITKCDISKGYYGETPSNRCVLQCSSGFQDNITSKCVATCPKRPRYYYGNPVNKQCVLRCPQFLYANKQTNMCVQPEDCQTGYFADDYSNLCLEICPSVYGLFGQPGSHRCVQSCPQGLYSDNTTRKCDTSCNSTAKLYKDPSKKACVKTCSSTPSLYADPQLMQCVDRCSNNQFAYQPERKCVDICPQTPKFYGDYSTFKCVQKCPRETYSFINDTFRGCVQFCPQRVYKVGYSVVLYADNTTWSCVPLCPESEDLYNFKHPSDPQIRKCVKTCPMVGTTYYFAQNQTQSCVQQCPTETQKTFGDVFSSKCQQDCTMDQFRDTLSHRCTYECSNGYFSDNTTWECVQQCPSPYYGFTTNKTCLLQCPTGFYAENLTRMCRADCQNKWYLFADNTTQQCVRQCPKIPNMFTNPDNRMCDYFCTLNRFADNNTGRCVPAQKCTDGQIAQTTTKRCVYQCPIQIPSFKKNETNTCVNECPEGSYADNSTMICVQTCPQNPDYYAYNHTTLGPICVLYCPSGYYRHSPTRQCLQNCPAPDYFKDSKSMSCVQQCPDHTFAQTIGQICVSNCGGNSKFGLKTQKKCVDICPDPYFANSFNNSNMCTETCPFTFYGEDNICKQQCHVGYQDPITKLCVDQCSIGYYSKLPQHICTKFCEPYFAYEDNHTCLNTCPASQDETLNLYEQPISFTCVNKCLPGWYRDNLTRQCTQTCSSTLFADNSTGTCVQKCPQTPDYYGYNRVCYYPCPNSNHYAQNQTRTCQQQCPLNSFADPSKRRCMDICTGTLYAWDDPDTDDNLCLHKCPEGFYASDHNKSCVQICQPGSFAENQTNKCVDKCPQGSFADSNIHVCVSHCSGDFDQYADPSTNRCVKDCPQVPSLYAQDSGRLCVIVCELNWFRLNTTRTCVYNSCPVPFFADPHTDYCAYKCQIDQMRYASNYTRRCQDSCPNKTFDSNGNQIDIITYADDSTKKCVLKCPQYPRLYGYNQTNKCVPNCLTDTYGDNQTRICHDQCFFGPTAGINGQPKYTWGDNSTNFCVIDCPRQTFASNLTFICIDICPRGTYGDNSTWRCVAQCPVNPLSYSQQSSRLCVYQCPDGYFGDQDGRVCSTSCPQQPYYYYRDSQNNRCVLNCTYPYFADQYSQNCTQTCQFGYFQNLAKHTCQKCPDSCISCEAQLNCTSCQLNLYMYDGQCIQACPSFPLRYFAQDLSSTCVLECQPPYFAFEGTGKCEIQCPQTFYSDGDTNKCQQCPQGCRYCYKDNCTDCLQQYVYASQFGLCSKACNSTHQYYINGQCGESCIEGTFMLSDLVTCQACSSQCYTCANIGTNCTRCDGSFWYNYMCVSSCPQNYFADSQLKCQYCGDNNQNCQLQPLSFRIEVETVNYKLYANVIFNRPVQLTKDQFVKAVKIKSNNKIIKPSKFIVTQTQQTIYRVQFIDSKSLNQQSLSFGFAPGVIMDQFGNTVTSTQQSTQVDTVTSIDQEVVEQTAIVKQRVNVLGWILMAVVFLLMIKYSYPLLLLVDTIQTIYMHTFLLVNPLPYLWYNVNIVLGYFHFNFLPKLYDLEQMEELPQKNIYSDILYDTTFLGNMSPFIFLTSIFLGIYLITWILTIKRINRFQNFRNKVKKIFKARMKLSFIFQAFYYTMFYTLFFAMYQIKGYNDNISGATANKGLAITVILIEVAMFILLIYVSAKIRDKILQTSQCIKKKKNIPKISKKYNFLVLQPANFPMELAIRAFIKILICLALQIQNVQAQLVLLISLNLIFLSYIIIFKPSLLKVTNRLNILLTICFIALQIVLFIYVLDVKSTENQQITSFICLAIQGLMVIFILIWMIYRFVHYIRQKCLNKPSQIELVVEPISKKKYYGRIKDEMDLDKQLSNPYHKQKQNKAVFDLTQKQINISELNEQDQADQQQEGSVDADNLIKQFAYHFVPQKTQGLKKAQNKLLGVNKKKRKGPLIINIDQDELVYDKKQQVIDLGPRGRKTGNLKIQEISKKSDDIELSSFNSDSIGSQKKMKKEDKKQENNQVWGNIDVRSNNSK